MTYIREKHPELFPSYEEIYNKKNLIIGRLWNRTYPSMHRHKAFPIG